MQPAGTLAARHVMKGHGPTVVLEDVSLVVPPRARLGVVGANGSGKTTLLRLLAGEDVPHAGLVERTPPDLLVGYLAQERDGRWGESVRDYLARRTGVAGAERRMDELAARLAGEPRLASEYAEAVERYAALGGDDLEARARTVCGQVGLSAERLGDPLATLSGGECARAALAGVLLSRFDVLLLDEPTNDLDFAGLELLERFLGETRAALVLVSHDRALLDAVVSRTVELEDGGTGIREWAGGWSEYAAARDLARARHYDAYEGYVEERGRVEDQARRMRQWEERGYGQGRKKKKTKDVRKAYEKKLSRLRVVEKPFEPWELRLSIAGAPSGGDIVARLSGAVVVRGEQQLGPFDLELPRGERLSVAGPNGSGKTTLIHALLGRLPLEAGTRMLGPGVISAELEQGREAFSGEATSLATLVGLTALSPEDGRTLLAKFGLGADHVGRPNASLSPGERTRAALASFAARGINLLVLDEPTNHLDLPAIEQLEAALERYEGTLVVVSHDRRFLERVAPTRTFELSHATSSMIRTSSSTR